MAGYGFYKEAFEERLAICMENGATQDEAVKIAEDDAKLLIDKYETQYFIKTQTLPRIKKELGLL